MKILSFLMLMLVPCTTSYSDQMYTKEDVLKAVQQPGNICFSRQVTPKTPQKPIVRNHAGIINCDEAVKNQTGTPGNGHQEICIEIPRNNGNSQVEVEGWLCESDHGCNEIDANGNINQSKWKLHP